MECATICLSSAHFFAWSFILHVKRRDRALSEASAGCETYITFSATVLQELSARGHGLIRNDKQRQES